MTDERLSAYLDGALDPLERTALEADLAASEALRTELDALAAVRETLRNLAPREAPFDLVDRLLQAGQDEGRRRETVGRTGRRWFAVASAAAAVTVALLVVSPDDRPQITPQLDDNADGHVTTSGLADDPIMILAPAAGSQP